ncbi:MAG: putative flap endonuclease-1-like 5' DNA nuclease [Paraglaciecola sp.]|jgi:predicted flap endonuclease-1-like 5' DNA nuclease
MAKKNQNTAKKKVKTDTSANDSLIEDINAKLKSGPKDLQQQVDELTTQVKALSKDPGKTARKLLKAIEKSYHKKAAQLHKDFDKRMLAVHKIQDKIIAHLPTELAKTLNLTGSGATQASKKLITPAVNVNQRPAVKPKSAKTPGIASINGIGPVTQTKLAVAGFTRLEDLAKTPASKTEALKQFATTKGFKTWKEDAQALLDKK